MSFRKLDVSVYAVYASGLNDRELRFGSCRRNSFIPSVQWVQALKGFG
jgi:hypothetical protein